MHPTRRRLLGALAGGTGVSLAGCTGGRVPGVLGDGNDGAPERAADADSLPDDAPPTAERGRHLAHSLANLRDASLGGGVGQDGIPSVDDPVFEPVAEADIDPLQPVFGVERGGEAKAYPQYILVWHEIVNDVLDGDRVAVTYCPLTGTAQGFERGAAEFGVSGQLVNSNLIMYDRPTGSWWPQMLATGIDGAMTGETLAEFRVVWTTFEEWAAEYPDAEVLTEETGYARRYGNDPYGSYVPLADYYADESTLFSPLAEPDEGHAKSVVLGARTENGAVAFDKATLLEEAVMTATIPDGDPVVAVADPSLSTGHVYRNPEQLDVSAHDGRYSVTGEGDDHYPDDLPLESVVAFDAMWFAWYGFYPDTEFAGDHTLPGDVS